MDLGDRMAVSANDVTEDALLDEIREAARHLRASAPDSALADMAEAKIARVLGRLGGEQTGIEGTAPKKRRAGES
ncbi:MAG TPA: hypothetical protein VHG30_09745 [Microvirga sp.]|nr:hypothetical protein [Microvirga sp.]